MDRVKAAVFSSLGNAVIGAHVLDLFAGSGALGIEALSRGDASVFRGREQSIARSRKSRKSKVSLRVREQDVFEFLKHFSSPERFEIIFADPAFTKTKSGERFTEKLLPKRNLAKYQLEPNGVFVLRSFRLEKIPMTKFWEIGRSKRLRFDGSSRFCDPQL